MAKLKVGGILDMSTLDYPGKISSVIFLHGCNFRCPFCFNYRLVEGKEFTEMSAYEIAEKISGFRDFIDAVVITGGEPTLQNIEELCRLLKKMGLLVKLDTNGTNPNIVKNLVNQKLVDFVAMDVKAPFSQYTKSEAFRHARELHSRRRQNPSDFVRAENPADFRAYSLAAGVDLDETTIKKIKKTFDFLISSDIDYELRCPVVPGVNLDMMEKLAEDVKDAKIFVLEQFWNEKGTLGNICEGEASSSREHLLQTAKLFRNKTVKIKTREKGEEAVRKSR